MNAVTFFKSMGLKAVKQYLENDNIRTKEMHDELKQIVDAYDCVMEHGSVDRARRYAESPYTAPEIKEFLLKAINLVEQCGV